MRWKSRTLLVATYGEPLVRAQIAHVGFAYAYPDNNPSSCEKNDHEAYERALANAQAIAQHTFFITHFFDAKKGHVNNLLCGSIDDVVEAHALDDSQGGTWDLFLPVERSVEFLAQFNTAKLVEGEPIACVSVRMHPPLPEPLLFFLGPPVQR